MSGDYSETESQGPLFRAENVGAYESNENGEAYGTFLFMGTNVHVKLKIYSYNNDTGTFDVNLESAVTR